MTAPLQVSLAGRDLLRISRPRPGRGGGDPRPRGRAEGRPARRARRARRSGSTSRSTRRARAISFSRRDRAPRRRRRSRSRPTSCSSRAASRSPTRRGRSRATSTCSRAHARARRARGVGRVGVDPGDQRAHRRRAPVPGARRRADDPRPARLARRRARRVGRRRLERARLARARSARSLGYEVVAACPEGYEPPPARRVTSCATRARPSRGADVVVTDTWVSMGQEHERAQRLRDLEPYRLDEALLALAAPDAFVLHCLPAHPGEEIEPRACSTATRSAIWDEAENRLHVQKALLALAPRRLSARANERGERRLADAVPRLEPRLPAARAACSSRTRNQSSIVTRGLRARERHRLRQVARLLGRRDAEALVGRIGLVAVLVEPDRLAAVELRHLASRARRGCRT